MPSSRWVYLRGLFSRFWEWVVGLYVALALWDSVTGQMWEEAPRLADVSKVEIPFVAWVIGAMAILVCVSVEGGYRQYRTMYREQTAEIARLNREHAPHSDLKLEPFTERNWVGFRVTNRGAPIDVQVKAEQVTGAIGTRADFKIAASVTLPWLGANDSYLDKRDWNNHRERRLITGASDTAYLIGMWNKAKDSEQRNFQLFGVEYFGGWIWAHTTTEKPCVRVKVALLAGDKQPQSQAVEIRLRDGQLVARLVKPRQASRRAAPLTQGVS